MDRDDKKTIHRYWQNMIDGTHFIKGVRDSTTQEAVRTGERAGITGVAQTMPGRGIEDLAGRQNGR
jgi:hypothetical protein